MLSIPDITWYPPGANPTTIPIFNSPHLSTVMEWSKAVV